MTQPLVSIIIPSHDRAILLKDRSIPSVLRQTYTNWEIIVVGDGPPSSSLREVVQGFNDPRIFYEEIERPEYGELGADEFWNCAGAAARNHGLSVSRGEVIAPLDDDDEFTPNHLAENVELIASGTADIVYGSVLLHDFETGLEKEDYFPWHAAGIPEKFLERNIMYHSSVCYSERFKNIRYPDDGSIPADYGLWLKIHQEGGKFASLDSPQAKYFGDGTTGQIRSSVPALPPFEEFESTLRGILDSRTLSNGGPVVGAFEGKIGDYLETSNVITTPSGDNALILSLNAIKAELRSNQREVVLPSYAHPSLINAILWNGLEPVFCDIDPSTLCVTPETIAPHINPATAAVAVLHPHGMPAALKPIHELVRSEGTSLLSDAAAALGSRLYGKPIGSFGHIETFSLSATKTLTSGEGGMISCDDKALADRIRRTARYGINSEWQAEYPGINGKLGEIPCALALAGLPYLDMWLARRKAMEQRYRELLSGCPNIKLVEPSHPTAESCAKDMVLVLPDSSSAKALANHLASYRIVSRPYYRSLHRMPAYRQFARNSLPGTEQVDDCTVCIPLYNDIRETVVDFVSSVVWEGAERMDRSLVGTAPTSESNDA